MDSGAEGWGVGIRGGDSSGGNVSDGELWGAANEASFSCPLLTSCCAALATDRYRSLAQWLGTPVLEDLYLRKHRSFKPLYSLVHAGPVSIQS